MADCTDVLAEGTGIEPVHPFGWRFSKPLPYHSANLPIVVASLTGVEPMASAFVARRSSN